VVGHLKRHASSGITTTLGLSLVREAELNCPQSPAALSLPHIEGSCCFSPIPIILCRSSSVGVLLCISPKHLSIAVGNQPSTYTSTPHSPIFLRPIVTRLPLFSTFPSPSTRTSVFIRDWAIRPPVIDAKFQSSSYRLIAQRTPQKHTFGIEHFTMSA
jgi:hypothetical protein